MPTNPGRVVTGNQAAGNSVYVLKERTADDKPDNPPGRPGGSGCRETLSEGQEWFENKSRAGKGASWGLSPTQGV